MSLTHGWIPLTVQAVAALVVLIALGWRNRRWRLLWIPVALVVGAVVSAIVYWYLHDQGLAGDPAPPGLWIWIALSGLAVVVLIAGWPGADWWRRGASLLAMPLCVLCAALALNLWVGYVPTVHSAWQRLTGAPLEGQVDQATVDAMQRNGEAPVKGTIVPVTIPDTNSGFKHREELVYLPPAWYSSNPPPPLPVVMMIGGEIGQPSDWLRSGHAAQKIDEFATAHGGNSPILVFVDSSGAFSNDTECVNGTRGNAADHLVKDVVPYVISQFGASSNPANWGIVGWSAGGTCALTLTTMHPELFSAFVSIDGQVGPNAGTKKQTIARLFGGDEKAWAAFDPRTVITQHGPYSGISAWFAVSDETPGVYRAPTTTAALPADDPGHDANYLCELVSTHGIECAVVAEPGKHDFSSASAIFGEALPWLAGKLGTPGVPRPPLPGAPTAG
jgi:S-formylglutathione hydrolase FrmB